MDPSANTQANVLGQAVAHPSKHKWLMLTAAALVLCGLSGTGLFFLNRLLSDPGFAFGSRHLVGEEAYFTVISTSPSTGYLTLTGTMPSAPDIGEEYFSCKKRTRLGRGGEEDVVYWPEIRQFDAKHEVVAYCKDGWDRSWMSVWIKVSATTSLLLQCDRTARFCDCPLEWAFVGTNNAHTYQTWMTQHTEDGALTYFSPGPYSKINPEEPNAPADVLVVIRRAQGSPFLKDSRMAWMRKFLETE